MAETYSKLLFTGSVSCDLGWFRIAVNYIMESYVLHLPCGKLKGAKESKMSLVTRNFAALSEFLRCLMF